MLEWQSKQDLGKKEARALVLWGEVREEAHQSYCLLFRKPTLPSDNQDCVMSANFKAIV